MKLRVFCRGHLAFVSLLEGAVILSFCHNEDTRFHSRELTINLKMINV